MSALIVLVCTPNSARIASAVSSSGPGRRATSATFSLRAAASRAIARPSPSEAPRIKPHGPYLLL